MTLERGFEIKLLMKKLNVTQEQLAVEVNCPRSYLSEVMNGKRVDEQIESRLEKWFKKNNK